MEASLSQDTTAAAKPQVIQIRQSNPIQSLLSTCTVHLKKQENGYISFIS